MKRFEKIALVCPGPFAVAAALFFAWSANYAAASFLILKSTAMWKGFTGDDRLMPVKQAWTYLANPQVRHPIVTVSVATGIEAVALTVGILALAFRPWEVRPSKDRSRFATRKDLEAAGPIGRRPGKSILLGTFGKGRGAIDVR